MLDEIVARKKTSGTLLVWGKCDEVIGIKQGNEHVGMHKKSSEGKWLGMTGIQAGAQVSIMRLIDFEFVCYLKSYF